VRVSPNGERLELERSGGFAGMTMHASIPVANLDRQEQAAVEELLRSRPRPPSGPDRFVYRLTMRGQEGFVQEDQVPQALKPLFDRLSGSWSFTNY
jgi:hypothetical protein